MCLQEFETHLTAKSDALQTFWHKLEIPKLHNKAKQKIDRSLCYLVSNHTRHCMSACVWLYQVITLNTRTLRVTIAKRNSESKLNSKGTRVPYCELFQPIPMNSECVRMNSNPLSGMSWVSSGIFGAFRALSDLLQDLSGAFGAYAGMAGTFQGLWIPRKGSKTKSAAIPPAPNPASLGKNGPIRLQLSKSSNELCKKLKKKNSAKKKYIYKSQLPLG